MSTTIVKVDRTFLEEQKILSVIMMNMFVDRSKAFYDALSFEVSKLNYGDVSAETIRSIQTRLRNQREIELMLGMEKIALSAGILFDYQQAIDFMEEHLIERGDIETANLDTEVRLAVLNKASTLFSLESFVSTITDYNCEAIAPLMDRWTMVSKPPVSVTPHSNPIHDVVTTHKPQLSEPRGKLKVVK